MTWATIRADSSGWEIEFVGGLEAVPRHIVQIALETELGFFDLVERQNLARIARCRARLSARRQVRDRRIARRRETFSHYTRHYNRADLTLVRSHIKKFRGPLELPVLANWGRKFNEACCYYSVALCKHALEFR